MSDTGLWKYCSREQCQEFILSLGLLPGEVPGPEQKEARSRQLTCLYTLNRRKELYYREMIIPKRDGGCRTLLAPQGLLKSVQRRILHRILDDRSVSPYATAYHREASLILNALPHTGKQQVLKMDIRHFFDSIIFPQIAGAAFPGTLFPPAACALLTSLCSYRDRLPQGAPTSPAISNLLMKPFDESMGSWCRERGIAYTRYCDDMTFSGEFDAGAVTRKVRSFLQAMGFEINEEKTRLARAGHRQLVTGIVVNEKPQAPREYRRRLRQELYYLQKYGLEQHLERIITRTDGLKADRDRYISSLLGRLEYVLQMNPGDEECKRYRTFLKDCLRKGSEEVSQ